MPWEAAWTSAVRPGRARGCGSSCPSPMSSRSGGRWTPVPRRVQGRRVSPMGSGPPPRVRSRLPRASVDVSFLTTDGARVAPPVLTSGGLPGVGRDFHAIVSAGGSDGAERGGHDRSPVVAVRMRCRLMWTLQRRTCDLLQGCPELPGLSSALARICAPGGLEASHTRQPDPGSRAVLIGARAGVELNKRARLPSAPAQTVSTTSGAPGRSRATVV
jgi:hypothetical protein